MQEIDQSLKILVGGITIEDMAEVDVEDMVHVSRNDRYVIVFHYIVLPVHCQSITYIDVIYLLKYIAICQSILEI